MIQDITFGENNIPTELEKLRPWIPITMESTVETNNVKPYGKTFDGCGHTISGIYVKGGNSADTKNEDHGLFGTVQNAEIKNLGILNSYIVNGHYDCGSFVGDSKGVLISNCYSLAVIDANTSSFCAGLVGYSYNNATNIVENCYYAGKLLVENKISIDAIGVNRGGSLIINNTYYANDCGADNLQADAISAESIKSGELAYNLNNYSDSILYYQTLPDDTYPVLDSTRGIVHYDSDADIYTNTHILNKIEKKVPSSTDETGIAQDVWYDEVCDKCYIDEQAAKEVSIDDVLYYENSNIQIQLSCDSVTDINVSDKWNKEKVPEGSFPTYLLVGKLRSANTEIKSNCPILVWESNREEVQIHQDPQDPDSPVVRNDWVIQHNTLVPVNMTSEGTYSVVLERNKLYDITKEFEIDNEGNIIAYYGPKYETGIVDSSDAYIDITIPEKINEITVKGIGEKAFEQCAIKTIKFPATLTTIGDGAFYLAQFYNCSLDLSSTNITEIKRFAFGGCSISKVSLPETLEVIGISAFVHNMINEVTIPKSVKYVSFCAFEDNLLQNVTFETNEDGTSALEVIETSAFPILVTEPNYYPEPLALQANPIALSNTPIPINNIPIQIGTDTSNQRNDSITVPACKIHGFAFGSIAKYFPSQSLSEDRTIHHTKSIVVTKNGDRELEISNLLLCDTQETQGNVQNSFYRMFDSFDN